MLRPASRTMPPVVIALIGLWRGIVRIRTPSVITMCLPWRAMRKPAFFQDPDRSLVVDAGKLRHQGLRDFYFTHDSAAEQILPHR